MVFCAVCKAHSCNNPKVAPPPQCPTKNVDFSEAAAEYQKEENFTIAKVSGILSTDYSNTRIEETMKFARACGYKKLGIAFCVSMDKEAEIIDKIFRYNGFETVSVICKVGSLRKDEILGIECKEAPFICNPIGQAQMLNREKTDLNILVGLCVGHDTLFFKYSEAPVSVLAVKDRVLAHNPLGAVYMSDNFMKKKLFPEKE
ncbi:DUF1847 domain-containing protein [Papillibacter cinnamivorans]|uniref:Uncharacterized metal-binding protein n=1 Tax=Papillibacter cinnamivorans DSM 12816 TaxID=1122930 RepID=A0A1W2BFG7_9FIRM|nr:DUF1847 domain-containing protein [Papillibacter cinnamivorans]SMC71763.1 Uncharacterized metal-binding protein [Papillibacter cinnamivorans DSM 12816]